METKRMVQFPMSAVLVLGPKTFIILGWARPPDVCHCGAATRGGQSSGKWELNCPGHGGHGRNTRTRYFSSG